MPQKPSQASQAYSDSHAYIPPHVQEAMAKQMEHMSPSHMKQYAGAYVQQNMVQGRTAPGAGKVSGPPPGYKPVTHLPRKDHYHQFKVQTPSKAENFLPDSPAATQPQAPYPDQQYQQVPPQHQSQGQQPQAGSNPNYEFFMNPEQPAQKTSRLTSSTSMPLKIGLVAGGLLILLIMFNVIRGLLAGPSNFTYYLATVQDQQAITHITSDALQQQDINTANKIFAATADASVTSSQSKLLGLLADSNKKVGDKQINLKISAKTDAALEAAAASGNYNAVFKEAMQAQLKAYMSDINATFNHTKSQAARAILQDQYNQAKLLSEQLSAAN